MHDQLLKLQGLLLQTLPDYETQVKDLKATVAEEQSNRERAVAAEQLATKAAQVERDSYKAQMEFYQSALKAVTKPCGGARKFFHYATLGIVACH